MDHGNQLSIDNMLPIIHRIIETEKIAIGFFPLRNVFLKALCLFVPGRINFFIWFQSRNQIFLSPSDGGKEIFIISPPSGNNPLYKTSPPWFIKTEEEKLS